MSEGPLTEAEIDEEVPRTRLPTQPGDLVAEKYEIERVLGAGGMGIVVAAVHLDLQEPVAIKFMLPEVATVPAAANRFLREAQAISRLKSEHIARLHDVGRLADGTPFMVMELLEGEPLDRLMDREGPLPIASIVDLVLQACEPLDEAHRIGIVHRDVKPENLFLADRPGEGPLVKVLDFGISKVQTSISITVANGMMGTATYSSPEQLKNPSDVGPSADVWSLGVILFEGLTGTVPFGGTSFAEICASVLHEEPLRARARRPEVPPELDEVVHRCITKDDALRITSMPELAAALSPFATEEGRALAARIVRRSSKRPDAASSVPPGPPEPVADGSPVVGPAADEPPAEVAPAGEVAPAAAVDPIRGVEPQALDVARTRPGTPSDPEVRPSFAESVTPLAMERELAAVPPPPVRRRWRAAAMLGLAAASFGVLGTLALGGGGLVPRDASLAGRAEPAAKLGPLARTLASRMASVADASGEAPDGELEDADAADEDDVDGDAADAALDEPLAAATDATSPAHPAAERSAGDRSRDEVRAGTRRAAPITPPRPLTAPHATGGPATPSATPPEASAVAATTAASTAPTEVEPAATADAPPPAPSASDPGYPFGVVPIYP